MAHTDGYPTAESHERLRRCAQDLIDHGVPPPGHGGALSMDALQLLFQRASSPDSAADALKLLHELQTYQVELDLLYEQIKANEHEVSEELLYYKSLFEQAPVAFLMVANDGVIIEANLAAGQLLGVHSGGLIGKALSVFMAAGQERVVQELVHPNRGLVTGPTEGRLTLPDHRALSIRLQNVASDSTLIMMVLAEIPALGHPA